MSRGAITLLLLLTAFAQPAQAGLPVPAPDPLLAPAPSATISVSDEDTVIVGEERIEDETRRFDDDVIVAPGGHLIVEDATVIFDVVTGLHPSLQVAPGGSLTITRSTITNNTIQGETQASRLFRHWTFLSRGPTTIVDSDLSYLNQVEVNVGPFTIEGSSVHDTWHSGIHVHRAVLPIVIRDNVVARNYFYANAFGGGIYLGGTRGAIVEGNVIHDSRGTGVICNQASTAGSYVWPDDTRIRGNLVYPGMLDGGTSTAVYLDGGTDALTVSDNAVVVSQYGIGTAYDTAAQVERNALVGARAPGGPNPAIGIIAYNTTSSGRNNQGAVPAFRGNVISGVVTSLQSQNDGHPAVVGNALLGATNGTRQLGPGGSPNPAPEAQLAAAGNWWGSADGPADSDATDGSLPPTNQGAGPRAFGNIAYEGWSTAPTENRLLVLEGADVTVGAGERATVELTLRNRASKVAVGEIWSFNAPTGWQVEAPVGAGVAAGGTGAVSVSVTAPAGATAGSIATIVVGVKGTNLVAASAATIKVTVA